MRIRKSKSSTRRLSATDHRSSIVSISVRAFHRWVFLRGIGVIRVGSRPTWTCWLVLASKFHICSGTIPRLLRRLYQKTVTRKDDTASFQSNTIYRTDHSSIPSPLYLRPKPIHHPPTPLPLQPLDHPQTIPHTLLHTNRPFLLPPHKPRLHPPRMQQQERHIRHIDTKALHHSIQRRFTRSIRVPAAGHVTRHGAHARGQDHDFWRRCEEQVW